MGLAVLPVEIYHREFDAKLWLAVQLAQVNRHIVLLGYDKHLTPLLPHLPSCCILDKSCSTLMWRSRILPVISNGGKALISDEEGFNNLETLPSIYLTRIDAEALQSISNYYCWGIIDQSFYSQIPGFSEKSTISGNMRSDLLSQLGHQYYSEHVSALESLYGDFVLCSDNFAVEHRQGDNYVIPKFNVSSSQNETNSRLFDESVLHASNRRDVYAAILHSLLKKFPTTQFVLRPHPISDPRWWLDQFWKYRNFHLSYHHSIEPWLHACKAMISFGCTTSVQAIIANKPVIEISPPDVDDVKKYGKARGFSHLFTPYNVSNSVEASDALSSILQNINPNYLPQKNLDDYWFTSPNQSRVSYFSDEVNSALCSLGAFSIPQLSHIFNNYLNQKIPQKIPFNSDKWLLPSRSIILKKFKIFSSILGVSQPKIAFLSNGLFVISPSPD